MDKKTLNDAFKILESQPLKAGIIYMDEQTFKDIAGTKCPNCGGMYFQDRNEPHAHEECEIEKIKQVMET